MAQEIELKLQIAKSDIQAFLALDCIKSDHKSAFILKNTYYDTKNTLLASHKIALRVRQKGDRFIQTLKTQGENQGGLHVRGEFEHDIQMDELDLTLINDQLLKYLPISSLNELELKPMFCTDFHRTEIQLNDIEVVFDQGIVSFQDLEDDICEIELELKNQGGSNQVTFNQKGGELLFDLALNIARHISVMPSDVSKALRGERLKMLTQKQSFIIDEPILEKNNDIQNIVNHMQYILTNWESFRFSKQTSYLKDALSFIDKLQILISNLDELHKFGVKIEQIKLKWSELLSVNSGSNVEKVEQDKTIGQTWLSLSYACRQVVGYE